MCTPTYLHEFAAGYLFTSGVIASAGELKEFHCDHKKWRLDITTEKDADLELLESGIHQRLRQGSNVSKYYRTFFRYPLESDFSVSAEAVWQSLKKLLSGSGLYRDTHVFTLQQSA